nr:hypothetical protein [Kocuria coralli]
MTLNVRRHLNGLPQPRADRWSVRAPLLSRFFKTERPALLAMQEVLPDQVRFVRESLGGTYGFVGRGRNARGGGEACPVFYDAARLELLDWRQTALSSTPEVPGSRSWASLFPRVMVSVLFRDCVTGVGFRAVNTHFDPCARGRVPTRPPSSVTRSRSTSIPWS